MAILKGNDKLSIKYMEISYTYHIPEADEGSRLKVIFRDESNIIRTNEFGWTNITLRLFIDLLKNFPIEKYNERFSHFDRPFEIRWVHEYSSDSYLLIIDDLGTLITMFANKEDIILFGEELERELDLAPSFEDYKSLI